MAAAFDSAAFRTSFRRHVSRSRRLVAGSDRLLDLRLPSALGHRNLPTESRATLVGTGRVVNRRSPELRSSDSRTGWPPLAVVPSLQRGAFVDDARPALTPPAVAIILPPAAAVRQARSHKRSEAHRDLRHCVSMNDNTPSAGLREHLPAGTRPVSAGHKTEAPTSGRSCPDVAPAQSQ
jgi:hypothetical protein